ncbi:hypothetical protein LTR86_008336 [Recurvomyces mirabilis]|nr:hypothetical protein LTR86_008336 [Recurvomyces mirabilis]
MAQSRYEAYSEPLPGDCTRLLQIRRNPSPSGNDDVDVLDCNLTTHEIADCPSYEAISYAWDEPLAEQIKPQWPVTLQGEHFDVTANLRHLLYHLADSPEEPGWNETLPRYYWIDALCINQNDNEERTAQVQAMHRIYRNASYVIIWLGPDPEQEAYYVREMLRALQQMFSSVDEEMSKPFEFDWVLGGYNLHAEGLPLIGSSHWEPIVRFWGRSWFRRTWVWQEGALARDFEFWVGGVVFVEFDVITSSLHSIMNGVGSALAAQHIGPSTRRPLPSGLKVGIQASRLAYLQYLAKGFDTLEAETTNFTRDVADRLVGPDEDGETQDTSRQLLKVFVTMIWNTYSDSTSEPRDQVFAKLVLMRQIAEAYQVPPMPLKIDYSKALVEVHLETMTYIIEHSGWLGILLLLAPDRRLRDITTWPSWLPTCDHWPSGADFPLLHQSLLLKNQIEKTAIRARTARKPRIVDRSLLVQAKPIGRVSKLGTPTRAFFSGTTFDQTSRVLVDCPPVVGCPGKDRIDWWRETMTETDSATKSLPLNDQRVAFRELIFMACCKRAYDEFGGSPPALSQLAQWFDSSDMEYYWRLAACYHDDLLLSRESMEQLFLGHEIMPPPYPVPIGSQNRKLFCISKPSHPPCPSAMLLGLGPEVAEEGDVVFLVAAAVFPLVLRPLLGDDLAGKQTDSTNYAVVGDAYLHDMTNVLDLMDSYEWQDIEIR